MSNRHPSEIAHRGGAATAAPIAEARPAWPDRTLDVQALRAAGWRPTPFRDIVLKIHQRCNLACDYCYVYTMADQSWRDRPMIMSRRTWRVTAQRMAEHATAHGLESLRLILHGGEPLLAGPDRLATMINDVREIVGDACQVDVQLQTNGVLLDAAMLGLLRAQRVRIGVSLDGPATGNDRHRRYADGRGSHADVDRALRTLSDPVNREVFAGVLCTVDPATDPIATYEALIAYHPPLVDLLLPHANWATPPDRSATTSPTPHADWLVAIFDRWYDASRPETSIRLFEDLLALILGGAGRSEQVGLSPVAVLVVESDGTIEQVDSLKSTYPGACATGLTVFANPFDDAFTHPGIVARQIGADALGDSCRVCAVHSICGAGHYAHRYRPGEGFRNASVYCADMLTLIRHVRRRVSDDLRRLDPKHPV
jgi:uncharacterized protein